MAATTAAAMFASKHERHERFFRTQRAAASTHETVAYKGRVHHMTVSSMAPKEHKASARAHAVATKREKKAHARSRKFKAARVAKGSWA